VKERPFEATDLPSVMEIYTASIHSLAAPNYSPDQIAAWAPVPPDAARWQERLSKLHTIVAECDGVLAGFVSYTNEGYLDFVLSLRRVGVARPRRSESYDPRQSCRSVILRPPRLPTRRGGLRRVPRRLSPPVRHAQTTRR